MKNWKQFREYIVLIAILAGVMVVVALFKWDERNRLVTNAVAAAEAEGYTDVQFRLVRPSRRLAVACGQVDGQGAVFGRDRRLLVVDRDEFAAPRYRRFCE
jgi:hypothetical protein